MKKRPITGLLVSSLSVLLLLSSCTEEFQQCRTTWDSCKSACPVVNETEWNACLGACNALLPDDPSDKDAMEAFNNCLRACGNPHNERAACLEQCDKGLRDCLGVEEE